MEGSKIFLERNIIKKVTKNKKGSTIVLLAAAMVSLLGLTAMVVDVGHLVAAKYKLVNAADASSLAGANELGRRPASDPGREMAARQTALDCALKNDTVSPNITVDGNKVTVDAVKTVDFYFAPVLGIHSGQVSAHAAARSGSLRSYRGIVPLVIKEDNFIPGQPYTLKSGKPISPGNFGGMDINDSSGASDYSEYIKNGYPEEVLIGGTQQTEPGNMTGPSAAIQTRIDQCTDGCTWDSFKPGCYRIITIPTHNETKSFNGKEDFVVTGFATFFVISTRPGEIEGIYVNAPGDGKIDFNEPINGLYGVKLVE